MEKQGQFVWNFRDGQIRFGGDEWLDLQREEPARKVRRVYVCEDTTLTPRGQTEVNMRIAHRSAKDQPHLGYVENGEVLTMPYVYNARSLIPARFGDIKVQVINTDWRSKVLPKGMEIGVV